ncbi:disease resistance protein At4g27190 [Eucalyptus grandis]|uniref:disease resistance protein At4g27190 n=1 Tax=Eucalyptus grandis TaxID=71139 RepID=UPI00192EA31F|nr:disease resistance protein At4g27190 [Eucalyptus grandis]
MEDAAASAACEVAKCLVDPVGRHCGYVIYTDRYVRQLNGEVKELDHRRQRVQHSIDEAKTKSRPIEADVSEWIKKEKTVTEKAHDVLNDDERAKKTCFYGWLPNPKVRYRLGKEASRTVNDIKELIARGQFEKVDFENPPPGLVGGASDVNLSAGDGGNTMLKSQASTFQGIMKALNDEKVKVVGVYGPGGVGKTTLMEEVEKKLRAEKILFHLIAKTKVLQNPNLKNIQDDIAYFLGLDLNDEKSPVGRADRLSKKLQSDPTKKILIILDDLWDKLDLKAVGIPLGNESRGCKLLLTSRYKDVLLRQNMPASPIFYLKGLEDNEAFSLFEKTVGNRLKDDEELKVIAPQVVKKLAGLPLLINSVANTLKDSDVYAWRNALIKIDEKEMDTIVKLSYDHLKSEDAKSLFLLCGLIGGTIRVETLLILGMGLGLFEEFRRTMQDARDRLNTTLDKLRSACLLLDDGDDNENVTIHDIYSEVVVSHAFRGENSLMMNSNYGSWPKEKLEKCWAICLADVNKDKLDELMTCRFPGLKILMLSQPKGWRWWQKHDHEVGDCSGLPDFTNMEELRALYLSMDITRLPLSIGILGNLHSLYLDNCNVQDVAILGKLKALQILSCAGYTISSLPREIGKLTNLRLLNLRKCYGLETIETGVLECLTNLEELYTGENFEKWMGKDQISSKSRNARLAELKSLTKLVALETQVLDPTVLLEDSDLPFGNLDRFFINIGRNHTFTVRVRYSTTMLLNLQDCESILSKGWFQKTLQKTQCLYLCWLYKFEKSAHELCTQGFEEVKYIEIKYSYSIKYIANSSYGLPLTAFTTLESLILHKFRKLEMICNGLITPKSFSKLRAIRVTECYQLKYFWSLSHWQRLIQLEEIEVQKCDSMQSIVTYDAGEGIVSMDNKVELPNVLRLILRKLPNMTSFCTRAEITSEDTSIQVSLPRLESLVIVGLLGQEKILYSELSSTYSYLRSLLIRDSKSTSKSILKLDWILKLSNLESMSLGKFPSAEVVFDLKELKVTADVEICSRLTKLTLKQLRNLQCMWKQDVKLQGISIFQNLRDLFVYKTGLSFLFSVSVAKCFKEIRVIRMWDCPNMKAVIVDEEGRNEGTYDIIGFPLLEHLSIRQCPMEKFFPYPHGKKEPITTTSDSQDAHSDSFFDRKVQIPSIEIIPITAIGTRFVEGVIKSL